MSIPWVEKYRPEDFSDIVLDPFNKKIFSNIIKKKKFPNLLLYGPPGTGKTTTIINLIKLYQETHYNKNKELIIHLNASDERDYMTKNAQQALKYLIQLNSSKIRFCLICNYISKIDKDLQDEFIKVRFNNLPNNDIQRFLKNILNSEKIDASDNLISLVQNMYKSDLRSMINYLQLNQKILVQNKIISNELWENLLLKIQNSNYNEIKSEIVSISHEFNIEKKNIIKSFLNYIIQEKKELITEELLDMTEFIFHDVDIKTEYALNFFLFKMKTIL